MSEMTSRNQQAADFELFMHGLLTTSREGKSHSVNELYVRRFCYSEGGTKKVCKIDRMSVPIPLSNHVLYSDTGVLCENISKSPDDVWYLNPRNERQPAVDGFLYDGENNTVIFFQATISDRHSFCPAALERYISQINQSVTDKEGKVMKKLEFKFMFFTKDVEKGVRINWKPEALSGFLAGGIESESMDVSKGLWNRLGLDMFDASEVTFQDKYQPLTNGQSVKITEDTTKPVSE
jgi:hypothetical protein